MFRRGKAQKIKENALSASELALQLAQDKKFRKRLLSAMKHGSEARRRARPSGGLAAAARRLAADQALQAELRRARADLQQAYARLESKRRKHRLRRFTFLVGLASLAAMPRVRERAATLFANAPKDREQLGGLASRIRATSAMDAVVPQLKERAATVIANAPKDRKQLRGLATRVRAVSSPDAAARPRALEDLTKDELYARAQEADIPGRSEMSKEQLMAALRAKS